MLTLDPGFDVEAQRMWYGQRLLPAQTDIGEPIEISDQNDDNSTQDVELA
jgi:hypothetical protein